MKRYLIILIMQCLSLLLIGQDNIYYKTFDQRSLFEAVLTGCPFQMKKTNGNQFFPEGSFTGDIILTSGDTVSNKLISYNGYEDELIWTISDNMRKIKVDREQVDKFVFHNIDNKGPVIFRHLHGKLAGNRQIDFFAQELLEDTFSLYVTHVIGFDEKIEQKAGDNNTLVDRIEPIPPVYYIGLPENNFQKIKFLRKKSLYNSFPEYKEAIRTLLIQHHQPLRNERDLIRIVQLFNVYKIIK
jgi:hypothetical protein